ncbi:MAG: cytochrome c3 family protein [Anaerolineales bacterium]
MGDKIFAILMKRQVQIAILIAVLALFGAAGYALYQTQIPPQQPIQFPHNVHVGLQIQCLYCHPGAWRQASAGLPTTSKCWGCHQNLAKYADPNVPWPPELEKLRQYALAGESIPWVPVFIVPEHVHFNHRPHVAIGLNCETCHGNISQVTVPKAQQVINMGWCLNCHRERAADDPAKLTKLTDCGTCHY